ncbi:MAG: leucine-rich repeat protein [Eggerthellaceae bacterium]|nr:leucine-rich repeat protein [Eggerthellaceae bacterium]
MRKTLMKVVICLALAMLAACGFAGCASTPDADIHDGGAPDAAVYEGDAPTAGPSEDLAALFTYAEDGGTITLTGYTGNAEVLAIPATIDGKTVTAIGDSCFAGNAFLKKVTVPEGVKSIGAYAFECCSRLERIYLPDSLKSIGEGAFSGCGKLFLADMQDSIEAIGKGAFLYCSSLTYLQLPEKLQTIGDFAFSNCGNLSVVKFRGANVREIPTRAFYRCEALRRITFPDSITAIGKRAFEGCKSLISLYFPGEVTAVGEYAFADCTSLASKPIDGEFVPDNAYEGVHFAFEDEGEDGSGEGNAEGLGSFEPYVPEPSEPVAEMPKPDVIGSIAGDKSQFNPADYADFKTISNDEFSVWSDRYLAFCAEQGIPTTGEEMVYVMLYKGEVIPHFIAMTAVQNRDPGMWEEAVNAFGDDFEETYLMMDHGLFTELRRGRMCDNLVLYSGVYDSQLKAAAGTEETPTPEQLVAAIGTTFTDPIMISTTTDLEVACGFGETVFIIYASKASMDSLGAISIDSFLYTNEKEILMCGGAQYKILDVGTMEVPTSDYEETGAVLYRNYVIVELQVLDN